MSIDYEALLAAALKELAVAGERLAVNTCPATPMPRPRVFVLVQRGDASLRWPCSRDVSSYLDCFEWRCEHKPNGWEYSGDAARHICRATGQQPRLILRALRRIQAATAWCQARQEGRQRAAQEILRQQASAVEALEAEAAIRALGR
jgi:hypothetical protein